MKNIHTLPTDKPSRLYYWEDKLVLGNLATTPMNRNIYITSDEEIKPSDYYLWKENEIIKANDIEISFHHTVVFDCKKIILTTDQDLIKDGVQAIDDEFLEWFVKNPSCESVEVGKTNKLIDNYAEKDEDKWEVKYHIYIPKEEPEMNKLQKEIFEMEQELGVPSHLRWHNSKPKQRLEKYSERFDNDESAIGNPETWGKRVLTEEDIFNQRDIDAVTDYIGKETSKQETLEEAAREYYKRGQLGFEKASDTERAFLNGAKWQQEQIGKSEFLQKLRATLSDAEARRLIFETFKNK